VAARRSLEQKLAIATLIVFVALFVGLVVSFNRPR